MLNGQLFTSDFLLKRITELPVWQQIDAAHFGQFKAALAARYAQLSWASPLNESQTEDELIEPVLSLLGWQDCLISQVNLSVKGREDVPDYLLFDAPARKAGALKLADVERAKFAVALLEAKRWTRPLDRADDPSLATRKQLDFSAPSSQMLRYLSRADVMSDGKLKWGVLSNGVLFRLYYQDARSRSEEFFEVDLSQALDITGAPEPPERAFEREHLLKLFYLLFSRNAFLAQSWDTQARSLHHVGLNESRLFEAKVSQDLGERVFNEVFPSLAAAIARMDVIGIEDLEKSQHPYAPYLRRGFHSRAYLEELREGTLVLLYRLLFVLYAEDRRLLPVLDRRFKSYSVSDLRDRVAEEIDQGVLQAKSVAKHWGHLENLFTLIDVGDDDVGVPGYNGGLFKRDRAPILNRARVGDKYLAPALDALSRRDEDGKKLRINFRDLSVSHLGSIYERLLEYTLEQDEERNFRATPASFARKASGSYYTHDELVTLVIDRTVKRLIQSKYEEFDERLKKLAKKPALNPADWEALDSLDPASGVLQLTLCDPAMGSGHFLVALVDYLADKVLEAAHLAQAQVNEYAWAAHLNEKGRPWTSPIVSRVADIRQRILKQASERGWSMLDTQLDDKQIIRRMILKKVIFGVDKNFMAVELAKLALWLHTFTVGAPLSFLNHHLKCGDSLHGEKIDQVGRDLAKLGVMFQSAELKRLESAASSLQIVADISDVSIAEVNESKRLADEADAQLAPVLNLLSFWRALRWLIPGWPNLKLAKIKDEAVRLGLAELFSGRVNLTAALSAEKLKGDTPDIHAANALIAKARIIFKRERFFHWSTAFPTVWTHPRRGFDGVLGNPPWDRMKLQQIEWFAERAPNIAMQARAADRSALIATEIKHQTELAQAYEIAAGSAEASMRVVRESDEYPLLSGGDINLYSLFVERAQALVHARGMIGLLTPSGITADKGASEFFRSISSTGRLDALFDFENKKYFFPDVHASFKFSALIFGASQRQFAASECAFFLHRSAELELPGRILSLSADDFNLVNPNTGAAPIFRTPKDAEITMKIYRAHPVLVNRSSGAEVRAWPVRYATMFHMTNDSALFLTEAVLKKQGFKPAPLNRWKKAEEMALPLYEGKMVQMYDHRAADVVINADNLHRAAQPEPIAEEHKTDPNRLPKPQFRVIDNDKKLGNYTLVFKDVTAPTNVRSMIAAILPTASLGNTLPRIICENSSDICWILASFASFAFDFLARQKIQGQHLNWFIVEQLPVITPERFEQSIGGVKISDFIRSEVLALTYTAHDMADFALDMGYADKKSKVLPPFVFDANDRAHRMARLDALFFQLYGLDEAELKYVLSTFPIVREKDEKQFGSYRTETLILGYFARLKTGVLSHETLLQNFESDEFHEYARH